MGWGGIGGGLSFTKIDAPYFSANSSINQFLLFCFIIFKGYDCRSSCYGSTIFFMTSILTNENFSEISVTGWKRHSIYNVVKLEKDGRICLKSSIYEMCVYT